MLYIICILQVSMGSFYYCLILILMYSVLKYIFEVHHITDVCGFILISDLVKQMIILNILLIIFRSNHLVQINTRQSTPHNQNRHRKENKEDKRNTKAIVPGAKSVEGDAFKSHIWSFGTLGPPLKIPPFSAQKCHSAGGRGGPRFFLGLKSFYFGYLGAQSKFCTPMTPFKIPPLSA